MILYVFEIECKITAFCGIVQEKAFEKHELQLNDFLLFTNKSV